MRIERDSDKDGEEEDFTSEGIFRKFAQNHEVKKAAKRHAQQVEHQAMTEERRQYN